MIPRIFILSVLITVIISALAADDMKVTIFKDSSHPVINPERGFYSPRMSDRMNDLSNLRSQGISLVMVEMNLRDFKERPVSPEKLDELRRAFGDARLNGLKVIFRAAYGFTNRDYRADPTDMNQILSHIHQLGVVLSENRDVLFVIQAGFLGPWGEWHGSNWGDPPSLEARRSVLFGLLDAVPSPIYVVVRRPMFIRDIFSLESVYQMLDVKAAFSGSRLSRTGYHDDSFLDLPDDSGTFVEPGWDRQRELQWCENHNRYTPFGGETVGTVQKTPIEQVMKEMEMFRPTYLNIAYHPKTLDFWRQSTVGDVNVFNQINCRLGYRLVAKKLLYPSQVHPGETVHCELTLRNTGYTAPMMPREVAIVLSQGVDIQRIVLQDVDLRRWLPENGDIVLKTDIQVPDHFTNGTCRLALHMPDSSSGLKEDARYAIQLANEDLSFNLQTGWNVLAEDIQCH